MIEVPKVPEKSHNDNSTAFKDYESSTSTKEISENAQACKANPICLEFVDLDKRGIQKSKKSTCHTNENCPFEHKNDRNEINTERDGIVNIRSYIEMCEKIFNK